MEAVQLVSFAASGGQIALALLAFRQRGGSPVALPLAVLCALLGGWTFCALAYGLTRDASWHWIDVSLSPLTIAVTLHVVLAFTGNRRRLRRALGAAYLACGALSISSAAAFASDRAAAWVESIAWARTFLALEALAVGLALLLLVRHLRETRTRDELARARLVLGALIAGALLGATELWDDLGLPVVPVGNVGMLAAATLLVLALVRHRLIERRLRVIEAATALLIAAGLLLTYLGLLRALAPSQALLVIGATSITLALAAIAWQVGAVAARQRRRLSTLALQGRLAEQLAHDLRNPLSAIRGALQFLAEERAQGRSIDGQERFLELMAEQVDRIGRVVDEYQRLGRVEPLPSSFDLNALVARTLELPALAASSGIRVETRLAADPPTCHADPDLVSLALENLVRNAVEAMPGGGSIHVATERRTQARQIALVIADSGPGMDARQREQAFDELYTTKPGGTGLGLAFVKRIAEAHGGSVALDSVLGRGTTVELLLPADTQGEAGREDQP